MISPKETAYLGGILIFEPKRFMPHITAHIENEEVVLRGAKLIVFADKLNQPLREIGCCAMQGH